MLLPGHLIWEIAQLPLYTLWTDATRTQIALAVVHCTAGDQLIGMSALGLAVVFAGDRGWPRQRFAPVALLAVAIGVLYTLYSEWLNVEVRGAWAYAEPMPRLPWLGTGLGPLAQWLVIPALGFWQVARKRRPVDGPGTRESDSLLTAALRLDVRHAAARKSLPRRPARM